MKNPDFIDVGRIIDEIFDAAEDFTNAFKDSVNYGTEKFAGMRFGEKRDFYPAYSYPPANVYITEDKTMVFEFALAGFREEDITVEFRGDHMFFSASVSEGLKPEGEVRYFKRRLKLKDVNAQKYYVPADKYNQKNAKAVFHNGILRVTVPPHDVVQEKEGVKINITKESDSGSKKSSGSGKSGNGGKSGGSSRSDSDSKEG
ncbi:MAG: Hsp20/alpha crystallin family protein [Spirochaetales bacterium]